MDGVATKAVRDNHRTIIDGLGADLAAISRLDDKGMRQRWRLLMGRPMRLGLNRSLALRILAYKHQAQRFGDLDQASRQALAQVLKVHDQVDGGPGDAQGPDAAAKTAAPPNRADVKAGSFLRPGTMLAREHAGVLHRVMVMENGFGWNGKTYDSLSEVAFTITGTKWSGPRFFGLRDQAAGRRTDQITKPSGSGAGGKPLSAGGSSVSPDGSTSDE